MSRFQLGGEGVLWQATGPIQIVYETVRKRGSPKAQKRRFTPCVCACGLEKLVRTLSDGVIETPMCRKCAGPKRAQLIRDNGGYDTSARTHGHWCGGKPSPTMMSWRSMMQRCYNTKAINYDLYGGRGITVCSTWRVFEGFLKDMGVRPDGKIIDRRDNDKGYYPRNCRWATRAQSDLNKRNTQKVEYQGVTKPLQIWAKEKGLKMKTLEMRFHKGWTVEEAFETEVRKWIPGADTVMFRDKVCTLPDLAEEFGINITTLRMRHRTGWDLEEALTEPVKAKVHNKTLTIDGVTKLIKEWWAEYGIVRQTYEGRIKKGWTPEQALGQPPTKTGRPVKSV